MSQEIEAKENIGEDKIPSALIKMTAEPLSTALSIAINSSFK